MVPSTTFPSAKSGLITGVIWGTCLLLAGLFFREAQSELPLWGKIGGGLFFGLVVGLLLWTWFSTYYRVSADSVSYRCGPLHGSLAIRQIREIKLNERLWSGLRPALGLHGMVLYYNRYDEIYFSPADTEGFIKALQAVNPGIVVR